jgi:colanic acid biosynthesis glycosyl transferase WcaI
VFVVNGDGAARGHLEQLAAGLPNVRFAGYQPAPRLPEVLASADLHVVPLRAGLGNVSVPSKTYSVLAAGRPVLAAIDAGTEVPRMLAASGGGRVVAPDDPVAFVAALREMLADPAELAAAGARGRAWVEHAASPQAVARAYELLARSLRGASDR